MMLYPVDQRCGGEAAKHVRGGIVHALQYQRSNHVLDHSLGQINPSQNILRDGSNVIVAQYLTSARTTLISLPTRKLAIVFADITPPIVQSVSAANLRRNGDEPGAIQRGVQAKP